MKLHHMICAGALLASTGALALDASSLKLQVYSVMMSTSPLCTSPMTLFSNPTPTEVDFLSNPTLGSGSLGNGTYNCIIIKMSDIIKYRPSTTSGSCAASTEYSADVCRLDNSGTTRAPDAGGAATACTGTALTSSADVVYMYLTTNTLAGTGGETFLQPTSVNSTFGINLTSPLVVSGSATSKFVVNATGKVDGSGAACDMNPPVFGFQKLP